MTTDPVYRRPACLLLCLFAPLLACSSGDSPSDASDDDSQTLEAQGEIQVPEFRPGNSVVVETDSGPATFQLLVTPLTGLLRMDLPLASLDVTWELRTVSDSTRIFAEMEFIPNFQECVFQVSAPGVTFEWLDRSGEGRSEGNEDVGIEGLQVPETFTWTWDGVPTTTTAGWEITAADLTGTYDCTFF